MSKTEKHLATLKEANGKPVLVPAAAGASLVREGKAAKADKPQDATSTPRGYGWYKSA